MDLSDTSKREFEMKALPHFQGGSASVSTKSWCEIGGIGDDFTESDDTIPLIVRIFRSHAPLSSGV